MHGQAALAQLGERKTEDLEVPGSIPGGGIYFSYFLHIMRPCGPVERRRFPKPEIGGSIPSRDVSQLWSSWL